MVADRAPYVVAALLVGLGLYVLVDDRHLVRKVVGLATFQTGVFLVYVAAGVRTGGRSPLVTDGGPYANPLPQVLVLTAIVVGVSVAAVAAALVVRIHDEQGTVRVDEIPDIARADEIPHPAREGDGHE